MDWRSGHSGHQLGHQAVTLSQLFGQWGDDAADVCGLCANVGMAMQENVHFVPVPFSPMLARETVAVGSQDGDI